MDTEKTVVPFAREVTGRPKHAKEEDTDKEPVETDERSLLESVEVEKEGEDDRRSRNIELPRRQ